MGKQYNISMEVAGATAMWTRPDTGDSPASYPAPTYSAAKGLFEAIARIRTVEVVPTKVEICAPLQFHNYATNYGGPLRKAAVVQNGGSFQVFATVLINVCYRFYADLGLEASEAPPLSGKARFRAAQKLNSLHEYQEIFNRRLKNGQCHDIPFLGMREFVPSYIGPFRDETRVCQDINLMLPSMLHHVFSAPWLGEAFRPNVAIQEGELYYA